jgi:hypothetical protein
MAALHMKYQILHEENGEFKPFETLDVGDGLSSEEANTLAQAHVEELQGENGGCFAAQIIEE